jgi:hypothetical protein
MSTRHLKRREWLRKQVAEQRRWIEEHGRDYAGYAMRYGSKHDPDHYGDGAEAIYAADKAALRQYEEALRAVDS